MKKKIDLFNDNIKTAINCEYLSIRVEELLKDEEEDGKKYLSKFKEPITRTINKAKRGDNRSLFRLIEWDKKMIYENWVKQKVLKAIEIDDEEFRAYVFEDICKQLKLFDTPCIKSTHSGDEE